MFKLVNKYVIAIISFYIFWLGLLPLVLSKTVTVLCNNFSHNYDYQISVENPKVRLYFIPVIKFKADSIYLKDKDTSDLLKADGVNIKLRLLPLLSGKVHLNKLKAESLCLNKEFKTNTILNKNFFKNLEKTHFIFDSIEIGKLQTKFSAEGTETPIIYDGKDIRFCKKNRYVSLNIDSVLKSENTVSKIYLNLFLPKNNNIDKTKFDIEVSNLNIEPLGEFFKNFLPKQIDKLYGQADILANKNELVTNLNKVKILYKDKDYSIIFPEKTKIKSKFSIKQDVINLENMEMQADSIQLFLSGKIKDYFGKTRPTLDLKVMINKSRVEDFVSLLPPFKVEEFDAYKLKKYKFYGNVLGNLNIIGRMPEPNITGRIYIDDGVLIKPIPGASRGATIKIVLTGRHANYDVHVPAGGAQKVWVQGTQELYNIKYGDLTVKSTSNVNLHSAEEVVNPLHEILNFIIGPVPILDVYGTGNIDIAVKGNRANPHAWGIMNFYNADVNFIEIPDLKLKGAEAVLNFNDTGAVFKTNKGQVNNKDFSISGTCNLSGNFDFDVLSENQPTNGLYNALQTSTMIDDVKKMLPKCDKITGLSDIKLKIYGNVKKIEDLKFNKNAFAKGLITLKDNKITIQGVDVDKVNANIKVDGTSANTTMSANVGDSPLSITVAVKNNIADLTAKIPKFSLNSLIQDEFVRKQGLLPYISLDARYKGDINNIEYDKLSFNAKILPQNAAKMLKFNSGQAFLDNGKLVIKNLDFYIDNPENSIKADLQITDTFSNNPAANGLVKLKLPDVKVLNKLFVSNIFPEKINRILKDYEFLKGSLNSNLRFNDGRVSTDVNLSGIELNYIPLELPVEVINGKLFVRNNDLRFDTINILADKMPILLDGEIKDVLKMRGFNIYLNSKPKQEFIDKFVNKNMVYPLKIKGDIVYNASLKGEPNNYDLSAKVNMAKEASIYYYGATVGDVENAIMLNLDSKVQNKKDIKIKEFLYDKVIDSQSGRQTRLNMLKVRGGINLLKDDIEFKDLLVRTSNPTDARIFNIIFGKPNIKQGQFTSDLRMRGKLSDPKILGDFHIVETNIPFLDTSMKNIEFLFKERTLEIKSKGEVFGNEISAEAVLKNKLTKPYYIENALISTKDMNLNRIVDKLKSAEAENEQPQDSMGNFDVNSIVANRLRLKADSVILRNIHAANFEAETSINEQRIFEMKDFKFNIAQGLLHGKYSYNLKNNDITLSMIAKNINANDITWAIFDLQNQIYGDLTGNIDISCNGENFGKCMQTLNGHTNFNVKDGRMPKLGSLEYLLKAGNLVKGGITGLSINGVIDLIAPMKTGEFSDIFGSITINDGIADNIEITTQGKNLSLFLNGTYNFATSVADMEVLGLLSRKISTMLGPIGNVSVNTLFNLIPGIDLSKESDVLKNINKIPGIEISNKAYRKFLAIIKGNINGDDYVTSFKWIN